MGIHGVPQHDRAVYVGQIDGGWLGYDVPGPRNPLDYIRDEYVWGWVLNLLVRVIGLSPDGAFLVITAVAVFTAACIVVRYARPLTLVLLLNPIFVQLVTDQLRISLALSVLGWIYLLGRKHIWAAAPLVAVAAVIHTSSPVFAMVLTASVVSGADWPSRRPAAQYAIMASSGIAGAVLFGPLRDVILGYFGDRRVGEVYRTSSGAFYVFWALLLLALTLSWAETRRTTTGRYALGGLWWVLGAVVTLGYPDRILASILPYVISAMVRLKAPLRDLAVLGYLVNTMILWLFWFRVI